MRIQPSLAPSFVNSAAPLKNSNSTKIKLSGSVPVLPASKPVTVSISSAARIAAAATSSRPPSFLPATSGDKNIDAVLAGSDYWWKVSNAVAVKSGTRIAPNVFQIDPAQAKHNLTFSWLSGAEAYLSATDKSNFQPLSATQKDAVRSALTYLSTLVNVTFTETNDRAAAKVLYGTNNQNGVSGGYANYPNGNGGNPSTLLLANDGQSGAANAGAELGKLGGYGWVTLIHEIGHTMGLKHPGNYNAGGGGTQKPYLPAALDNRRMSIMSYKNPTASISLSVTATQSGYSWSKSAVNPTTFGVFDIAALQYLYGAITNSTATNLTFNDGFSDFKTVWAPKGVKVDAGATSKANIFDLREGAYSSISVKTDSDQKAAIQASLARQGMSEVNAKYAVDTIYKREKGLAASLYNGKNNLALAYGSTYSEVYGGSSADKFYASNYSVTIDGKLGNDTLLLMGTAKDWSIDAVNGKAINRINNAVVTYKNIEAIAYYKGNTSVLH